MKLQDLPKLGEHLDGGIFAGVITKPDGTHCAVVLLPGEGHAMNWSDAKAWATAQGGELPSRLVSALLFANVKDRLRPKGHWTSDEVDAFYAGCCDFGDGYQDSFHKFYKCLAVAVRSITVRI